MELVARGQKKGDGRERERESKRDVEGKDAHYTPTIQSHVWRQAAIPATVQLLHQAALVS